MNQVLNSDMTFAVCTLFDGDHHYGTGALINSLYYYGFRGIIWIGYRGGLPHWAREAKPDNNYSELVVAEGLVIRFIEVNPSVHLARFKPKFMLELWDKYCPQVEALYYFDTDIVVKCRWAFFEEWVKWGIGLCQNNGYTYMSSDHPFRLSWVQFAKTNGLECQRTSERYFNSGFVGIRKEQRIFLEVWHDVIERLGKAGTDLTKFQIGDPFRPFFCLDQDALNLAIMLTTEPLSTLGPEGMDFIPGGSTMSHAAGVIKPWRKRILLEALKGNPPNTVDKGFWRHTQTPIALYPSHIHLYNSISLRCGALLGRFIRRT